MVLDQEIGKNYAVYNGDSVEAMKEFPDDSIHLSI